MAAPLGGKRSSIPDTTLNPNDRLEVMDAHLFRLQNDVSGLGVRVQVFEDGGKEQMAIMKVIAEAVGCSPDAATGTEGKGLRGQVAMLVEQHEDLKKTRAIEDARAETWRRFAGGLLAFIGALAGGTKIIEMVLK